MSQKTMVVRVMPESEMPVTLDRDIRALLCKCFPKDEVTFSQTRKWHGCGPAWTVLFGGEKGCLLAHVGIVDRVVCVGRASYRIGGVQNVCVLPQLRGHGLAARIMLASQAVMYCHHLDAGLLFCVPELERVYARTGWLTMPCQDVVRVDEGGNEVPLPAGNVAMWLPIRHAGVPDGSLHLNGNDW